jgi:starch synthase
MKILFVSSEASPIARVGGLAEVVGSLPRALKRLGHDVRVILPGHRSIKLPISPRLILPDFRWSGPAGSQQVDLYSTEIKGVPFYLIGNSKYFDDEIYGNNELEKYYFYSSALGEILPNLEWQPEIVHCHDWHTALLLCFIKSHKLPYHSLFTIHNMAYQGWFDEKFLYQHNLDKDWYGGTSDSAKPPLNFLSQGITCSDFINTVSENYAREILTPEFGNGLVPLLKFREKLLVGITNGIDYEDYNPEKDDYLTTKFSAEAVEKRRDNKRMVQSKLGLSLNDEIPLIGLVQRLDEQKGIDLIEKTAATIIASGAQIAILGQGRKIYEESLSSLASQHPNRMSVSLSYREELAHQIYGGCDMFMMPSKYEPCGLGQLIAMRYGAIPIVRHTGGLVDTVSPLNDDLSSGSGFVFKDYSDEALLAATKIALFAFRQKEKWQEIMRRVMKLDFSWDKSAKKYQDLYLRILDISK